MKSLSIYTEAARNTVYQPSDKVNAYVLSGTAKSITVPSGAQIAVFSGTSNFFVNFQGGTATVPGADITDGTGSELNPTVRSVAGLSTLSVNATSATVTVAFYNV